MKVAAALGGCGELSSLELLKPFATSGEFFNSLTSQAVEAIQSIGERLPKTRKAAFEVLKEAYPPPPSGANDTEQARSYCEQLAKRVHAALEKLTGKKVAFPQPYNEAARKKLMSLWSSR
jgi:hypothetical protein